ncbi:PREDICTED: LEAF RUST 10 DISEASE-RESISTANCE LOCUS RECEPTOR-LIKE PROTEIN KINASE-like 2.3 [Nelumbo nucifera]|uniref:LEAF RUST 10 DISEASE-RESISTANCE LOCUS RECEPTOR-LIKE PROTEIN KINASE-like 2.3 n=1 Tax=Nelumbo nucifera TaxID=4432 RepID=A0A1U7ZXL6_NELNU|nr:PREDICTED: LEAF RUST 10 DISEASE-RESISTANCE LOCUS RECEPTOR-LIKE PROTEIN KINASE-like 2.3 [Nelumbo nucifera]
MVISEARSHLLIVLFFGYLCNFCSTDNPVNLSTSSSCPSSSCGGNNSVTIRYPFWLKDPAVDIDFSCRLPGFGVSCSKSGKSVLRFSNDDYYVQSINYSQNALTVVNAALSEQSCPIPRKNVSLEDSPFSSYGSDNKDLIFYFNCSLYPSHPTPVKPLSCPASENREANLSFVFVRGDDGGTGLNPPDWNGNCQSTVAVKVAAEVMPVSVGDISEALRNGFRLNWSPSRVRGDCKQFSGCCWSEDMAACSCYSSSDDRHNGTDCNKGGLWNKGSHSLLVLIGYPVAFVLGGMILMATLCCCIHHKNVKLFSFHGSIFPWRRRIQHEENIEVFLESYGSLVPKRYKYSDIQKMTNSFQDKLGEGGCGAVFKGKLVDGRLIAVKILGISNRNVDLFINEFASVGRTNHRNIVTLLGFCFEGSKRALIYEYMPNGSLEKLIYFKNPSAAFPLGWENLYQIALGIARGLEYLHLGCTMRILHFDIKPHNILLDRDFCPKISDFGLAKLCPKRESLVSVACARGTAGYIAPEFFSPSFGGVSYKSDVFSYGVMVLEMVGGRKSLDLGVENSSEIYFPHWIYDRIKQPSGLGLERFEDGCEEEVARKMILVGLWCVQIDPVSRPSMSRVVEMLEGSIESLQIPPRPPYF